MKKITLLFSFLALAYSWHGSAQILNQNAGWPNVNWSVTGTYNTDPLAFEADPTLTANFAFDDDDAGNGSDDNIAAESPVIDVTAAFNAGETWLTVTADYVYNYSSNDELVFQYWNADASSWVNWGLPITVDTAGAPFNDFCVGTPETFTSDVLDIGSFTALQQSGFRYRISYNDDPAGSDWNYGFCFQSPTITSSAPLTDTADWNNLQWPPTGAITTGSNYDVYSRVYEPGITDAVGQGTGIEAWIGYDTADTDPSAGGWTWISSTFNVDDGPNNDEYVAEIGSGLSAGTYYYASRFRVNGGPFTYGGTGGFWANDSGVLTVTDPTGALCSNPIIVGALPYNTSDDTANYGDDYTGSPGATGCGTTSSYLNGDDVVYAYTAASDTSINIGLSAIGSTYSGIFVYTDCADIGTACVAGEANSGSADRNFDLAVINGNTYYIVISTWASPQSTTYTLDITENTCTDATVTYTVVDDCASSGGFLIDVEITDMGTATAITVSNDQDVTTFPVTSAPTTVQFGPYANATDVVITVVDDNDGSCTQNSGAITQGACPPANDDCANATGVTSLPYNEVVDASGATNNAGFISDCAFGMNDGVWYTFTTINGGTVDIAITGVTGWDPEVALYSGSCGTFTCVASADSGSAGGSETITGATVAAGTQYWINIAHWSGSTDSSEGPFTIDISTSDTTTLPVSEYVFENFKYFPNPVNDNLNLRAQSNIQNVSIYNMLGQEVSRISPNAISSDVDMSALQTGVYFVNVTINDTTETIRIVKQ